MTPLVSPLSQRQLFNKAGMSPALSALFSFRRAAAEVMCVLLKYLWRTPGRHAFTAPERERRRDGSSECHAYENIATDSVSSPGAFMRLRGRG